MRRLRERLPLNAALSLVSQCSVCWSLTGLKVYKTVKAAVCNFYKKYFFTYLLKLSLYCDSLV
uniref:Uncharacterized protein n=1 Tax=Xiphophorus maculatus TaxID=8083 RepID=A0A3B5R3D6_XIPMA